ncbi:DNA-(apurinic or apyrimidinic site) endonuclease [Andrographis paniculata]|uniref:DNA-(apurinic or apyrimidinic site) endonuclease n=1 Tax=Andrographis paniculata TaxID=175694 RepID=UPI0021E94931|nr:DNA-(apurinic or apyrimidinic site) endonuclease [Andrographis paniculata]
MKRFFKPIEKDGSFKKPALSSSSSPANDCQTAAENVHAAEIEEACEPSMGDPSKFLTWNANSLLLRIKNNWTEFSSFVQNMDPDVIAIQEVRMPAAGSKGAPKNPRDLKDDTSSSREEKQVVMRALSSLPFKNYNVWWSLSDSKYAGTALFIKKCFQPKKVSFSLDQTGSKHEPDGRVILAEFESFRLLNTYVPNNGWKDEESSFQRRRKWDKRMLEFVLRTSDKPLIWCGDLNVSHQDIDVSHPEFFSAAKLNGYVPPNKEDCGQPGFTISERKRFGSILKEGKLVDAYRNLHEDKDMESGFSWSGNPIGKYRGKRMRIDYFIVSEKLKERIVACEIHGKGIELEGFYGSDHCPVSLELSDASPVPNGN